MTADFIREQIQHTGISESIKLARANEETASAFESFLAALRLHVSVSISEEEAAEMLVQHILTKPVFDALFHSAVCRHHPVSQALDKVAGLIESMNVPFNAGKKLPEFYDKVRRCAAGADSAAGKQKMIIELYDQFFKTAFPKMSARLGIVYTPLEVVDFILHSVDYVLRKDFGGGGFNAEGNEILDPFTGTGIFIVRLLQSGLIAPENLRRKYENEIRAHEIVLLAYYIAAVNIDNAFREMISGSPQLAAENGTSFPGLILADTFTLTQNGQHAADKNSKRIKKHQDQPVRIIIGNPPYSAGQKSANDNNQNQKYDELDKRISQTYAAGSSAQNKNSLYDAYMRSFRWASDRIGSRGVIAFVTNIGWLDGNAMDGFRKCLAEEFDDIYVFNLRGSIRGKRGAEVKKEGQNVFNIMTGVGITLLVKKGK